MAVEKVSLAIEINHICNISIIIIFTINICIIQHIVVAVVILIIRHTVLLKTFKSKLSFIMRVYTYTLSIHYS